MNSEIQLLFKLLSVGKQNNSETVNLDNIRWDHFFAISVNHAIAPFIYKSLLDHQLNDRLPSEYEEAFEAFYSLNKVRNNNLKMALDETITILNSIGIVPILLKGSHALYGLIPDSDQRMLSDIDLLVPSTRIIEAQKTLLDHGYYPPSNYDSNPLDECSGKHQLTPLFHHASAGCVELHRHANFTPLHPRLIEHLFKPENLQLNTENLNYYSCPENTLFLYSLIHHYCDKVVRTGTISLRYLREHSAIIACSKNNMLLDEVEKIILSNDKSFMPAYQLVNSIAFNGLQAPIDEQHRSLRQQQRKQYQQAIGILNKEKYHLLVQQLKVVYSYIKHLRRNIKDPEWRKERFTNLEWYKQRISMFKSALSNHHILH